MIKRGDITRIGRQVMGDVGLWGGDDATFNEVLDFMVKAGTMISIMTVALVESAVLGGIMAKR